MLMPLKFAIIESGRTQKDIANAANLHETTLSLIVRGRFLPTTEQRAALASALGKREADLFEGSAYEVRSR